MYLSLLCHALIVGSYWMLVNCMTASKKAKDDKKTLEPTPITYETDPVVLDKERKQKAAETRAKTRKKRDKLSKDDMIKMALLVEEQRKSRELIKMEEETTQPSISDDCHTATTGARKKEEEAMMDKTADNPPHADEGQKIAHMKLKSDSEFLGNVRLVDHDPDAAHKNDLVKKQAHEAAKDKEVAEAVMRKFNLSPDESTDASPDHTLKNVSSIQYESQLSTVQKKRKKMEQKQQPLLQKETGKSGSGSAETAELVAPKSNELYARDKAAKI